MALGYKFGGEPAPSEYVCVGLHGLEFDAGEGRAIFTSTSVDMNPPHEF